MASASPAPRIITSLRIGERVVVRSDGGLLATEYGLFDLGDIVLRATDPVTVREAGYMTTAREALERLGQMGVTPALALEAARALGHKVAASYARGRAARSVVGRLGPQELFDGALFDPAARRYEGAWLDLRALTGGLSMDSAPLFVQALHLAAALAEVEPTTTVHLSTAAVTRDRRPGERTHLRVALDGARAVPDALRKLTPLARPLEQGSDGRLRDALLARVRERMSPHNPAALQSHLGALEGALSSKTMPIGPLADPELRAIERTLASGDVSGVDERLDDLERSRGRAPGIRYLRARAALLRGEEPPRSVAQALSELASEDNGFHEAALVAARTWLAAGEDAHARYFAHKLAEDPGAKDSERMVAIEILDTTAGTTHSNVPPPTRETPPADPYPPAPRLPLFPSLGDLPPPEVPPAATTMPPARESALPLHSALPHAEWLPPKEGTPPPRAWPQPTAASVPPQRPSAPPLDFGITPKRAKAPKGTASAFYQPELVEALALPPGTDESSLGVTEVPRSPAQARVAMTRLARDLARDYRLWYGKTLRCNVLAIDAMQQHLTHRFAGAPLSDARVAWELRRHGALLSETIARALGGVWIDVAPSEPGYWAMLVPPATRSCPIGRVYRFVALGHREKDLVGYYLDLETRVRKGDD
ncbi:MAG TPA: hypothetical protein VKU41_28970 [Polyangiaceae bacterium]|nr:hypothetical protein [Polyangiaceae bacterium]